MRYDGGIAWLEDGAISKAGSSKEILFLGYDGSSKTTLASFEGNDSMASPCIGGSAVAYLNNLYFVDQERLIVATGGLEVSLECAGLQVYQDGKFWPVVLAKYHGYLFFPETDGKIVAFSGDAANAVFYDIAHDRIVSFDLEHSSLHYDYYFTDHYLHLIGYDMVVKESSEFETYYPKHYYIIDLSSLS